MPRGAYAPLKDRDKHLFRHDEMLYHIQFTTPPGSCMQGVLLNMTTSCVVRTLTKVSNNSISSVEKLADLFECNMPSLGEEVIFERLPHIVQHIHIAIGKPFGITLQNLESTHLTKPISFEEWTVLKRDVANASSTDSSESEDATAAQAADAQAAADMTRSPS